MTRPTESYTDDTIRQEAKSDAPPRGDEPDTARQDLRTSVGVGLLLFAGLVAFFAPTTIGSRVLAPADHVFTQPAFSARRPPGFERPTNELLFDAAYQFVPWRRLSCDAYRRGALPLWNPDSLCGTPILGTLQNAAFYPPNVALCALPLHRTFAWSAVVRLWIAGFSAWLLARHYGLGVAAGLVSGVSFMLCGFLLVWLEHPHTNVAIWLPALVLLAERLASGNRRAHDVALLALVVGIQFTGGHIETSVDVLAGVGLYFLVRWLQVARGRPAAMGRLVAPLAGVALGTGLAAAQLVPFVEWLGLSAELRRRSTTGIPTGLDSVRHLLELPLFFFPNIYNNPTWRAPYRSFLPWGNFHEQVLYVGVVTLLLALAALVARWRTSAVVRSWAIVGGLALGMCLRLPGFELLNHLPGLALSNPDRLRLIVAFALAVLAGFGLDALSDATVSEARLARVWRVATATVAVAGALLAAIGIAVLPAFAPRIEAAARAMAERKYAALAEPSHPLEHYLKEADRLAASFVAAFRNPAMYLPVGWALAALVVVGATRPGPRRRGALAALVALDLATFGWGYHSATPAADFYPRTTVTDAIAAAPGLQRFTAIGETFLPDTHLFYGIADVRGLDWRTAWLEDYLSIVPDRVPWIPYGVLFRSASSPLLRVLNVGHVIAKGPEELGDAGAFAHVERHGDVVLGRLARVQPRSFMVYDAAVAESDAEAQALLGAAPERVFSRVVLIDGHPAPARAPDVPPSHEVVTVAYGATETRWTVTTTAPGWLVTTDAYYPGWNAYLDGRRVPLLRANLAFRAVEVPAGTHEIHHRYEPVSVRLGLLVSAASALAIVGLAVAGRYRT